MNLKEQNANDIVEPINLARRREFPDMLRDLIAIGHTHVQLYLDANTALNLADDLEYAVKYRDLYADSST